MSRHLPKRTLKLTSGVIILAGVDQALDEISQIFIRRHILNVSVPALVAFCLAMDRLNFRNTRRAHHLLVALITLYGLTRQSSDVEAQAARYFLN